MTAKAEGSITFTPLNLPIDQIFHIVKHQPWFTLLKTARHDSDSLEEGIAPFMAVGNTTRRIVGHSDVTSRTKFNENIWISSSLTQRKNLKSERPQPKRSIETPVPSYHPGWEEHHNATF